MYDSYQTSWKQHSIFLEACIICSSVHNGGQKYKIYSIFIFAYYLVPYNYYLKCVIFCWKHETKIRNKWAFAYTSNYSLPPQNIWLSLVKRVSNYGQSRSSQTFVRLFIIKIAYYSPNALNFHQSKLKWNNLFSIHSMYSNIIILCRIV